MNLTPGPSEDQERSDAKDAILRVFHELHPRIPGLEVGDCHCNLLAEVALDALNLPERTVAAYRTGREDAAKRAQADSDVLREEADRYESSWRAAAGVGAAVPLPQPYASFVGWLRERARGCELKTALNQAPAPPVAAASNPDSCGEIARAGQPPRTPGEDVTP